MRQFMLFLMTAALFTACQSNDSADTAKASVNETPTAKTVALKNGVKIGENKGSCGMG